MKLVKDANGKLISEIVVVADRHQFFPELTGDAIVACRRRSGRWIRDKQLDWRGERFHEGFKEDRTERKHRGRGGSVGCVGPCFKFLLEDAVQELLHQLPAVDLAFSTLSTVAHVVHRQEPFRIGHQKRLGDDALTLDVA